jgi:hypothetical protein
VDLLVSTLALPRIGFLEDDHVVPMAGNDTFTTNQGKLSCAIEGTLSNEYLEPPMYNLFTIYFVVYYHSESKTAFIQLRSPIAKVIISYMFVL